MSAATPIALPISNNRLLDIEHNLVRFQWKDYRDNDRQKTMTLSADEFIRRFLIHVLPDGFQRIRYYGFLSNCHRNEKLALCRQLLGMAVEREKLPGDQLSDYDYEALYCNAPRYLPASSDGIVRISLGCDEKNSTVERMRK